MRGILLFGLLLISFSCFSQSNDDVEIKINDDSVEYQIIIIDPGFDFWLKSQGKPMNYYTQKYYESWNYKYVQEWNARYSSGRNTDIIESFVDYQRGVDYGLELNYRLYFYFQYFEKTNKITLIRRAGN